MSDPGPVFVISGQLSAGKSTVARAVMGRFPFGCHVDVDGIREMVVSGQASPLEWNEETTRQFDLAIDASASLARIYSDAGFAVAIEGGLDPEYVERALGKAGISDRLVGVVLHPRVEVALDRNRERTHKSFDTSVLEGVIGEIDADLRREGERPGWHVIDNSDEPLETTVDRILALAP